MAEVQPTASAAATAAPAPAPGDEPERGRAFTVKALVAGLFGLALVSCFSGFNDDILKQTYFVNNFLPVGVFTYIFFLVGMWNPACFLIGLGDFASRPARWMFSGRELAVVLGLSLCACWVPTSGLHRYFPRQLVIPTQRLAANPGWDEALDRMPDKLFPDGRAGVKETASEEDKALYELTHTMMVAGSARGYSFSQSLGFANWPWQAWLRPLAYWGPLLLLFGTACLSLSLLVHRQWSRHEQLAYPIATLAGNLIDRREREVLPPIFREPLFWATTLAVVAIHGYRMVAAWWPSAVPPLFLNWSFEINSLFPSAQQGLAVGGGINIAQGTLFFMVVGLMYFLPSEIGFTLGITNFLCAFFAIQYYLAVGRPVSSEDFDLARFGAYIGYALILVYAGRTWYWTILKKALGRGPRAREHEEDAIMAARVLMASAAGLWAVLCVFGLDWLVAAVYTAVTLACFLVFTRMVCEAGLPFGQMSFQGFHVPLIRLLGYPAVGAKASIFLRQINIVLAQDPREALMPFAATSLRVADDRGIRLKRLFTVLLVGIALAVALGFWARTWGYYSWGASQDDWAFRSLPDNMMRGALQAESGLKTSGLLAKAEATAGWAKLALVSPQPGALTWFGMGMGMVFLLSMLRFRYTWWPLHPIFFLIWQTFPANVMGQTFLIGWAVKALVVQFGGGRVYQRLKPLFIGLIAGELLIAGASILIGFAYYCYTGQNPDRVTFFPG